MGLANQETLVRVVKSGCWGYGVCENFYSLMVDCVVRFVIVFDTIFNMIFNAMFGFLCIVELHRKTEPHIGPMLKVAGSEVYVLGRK